jgi:PKD domain/Bacterial Ig domain
VLGGPTYMGTQYPAGYRDDVFFGDYAQGFIRKANLDAEGRVVGIDDFASDWSGVDLEPDPSGDLAYASFGDGSSGSGSIRRIVYSPGNASPVAMASAAPTSGRSPLDVSFTGSPSTDPDGDPLSYDWDFGDGSPHSSQANPTHRFTTNGAFAAQLTVSDGRGLSGTDAITISVGDPPVASIDSPAVGGVPANPPPGGSSPAPPAVGAGRDVTRPVVRITSPARRVRVSGRIMVRAFASDNVGVRSVQFMLDGKRLGRADARAPFRVRWNTRRRRNGGHRLTAVARDGAGNTTTSRVVWVMVRNNRPTAPEPRLRRTA